MCISPSNEVGLPLVRKRSRQRRSDIIIKMIKIEKLRFKNILIIVSLLALIILYCLLQPRISGIFPFMRQFKLHSFLESVKNKNTIPTKEFWQFREFYYPGSVEIDRTGSKFTDTYSINPKLNPLLFFQFKSRFITSNEYLIASNSINLVIPSNQTYIINEPQSFAYREDSKKLEIIFIKPIHELTEANGFIYEKDQDEKLVANRYWLVVTTILK